MGIGHEGCYFGGDVPRYRGTSYLIDTQQLGRDLVAALGGTQGRFMNNHGVVLLRRKHGVAGTLGIAQRRPASSRSHWPQTGYRMIEPPRDEVLMKESKLARISTLERFWEYYVRMLHRYEKVQGKIVPLQG